MIDNEAIYHDAGPVPSLSGCYRGSRPGQAGSGWLDDDFCDVEARADKTCNPDDLHAMFQNLLADEFKLKFHKETKEGPVYALTGDKGELKMRVNESPQDFRISMTPGQGAAGSFER